MEHTRPSHRVDRHAVCASTVPEGGHRMHALRYVCISSLSLQMAAHLHRHQYIVNSYQLPTNDPEDRPCMLAASVLHTPGLLGMGWLVPAPRTYRRPSASPGVIRGFGGCRLALGDLRGGGMDWAQCRFLADPPARRAGRDMGSFLLGSLCYRTWIWGGGLGVLGLDLESSGLGCVRLGCTTTSEMVS